MIRMLSLLARANPAAAVDTPMAFVLHIVRLGRRATAQRR
jgi:hypothetical protein